MSKRRRERKKEMGKREKKQKNMVIIAERVAIRKYNMVKYYKNH